MSDTRIKEAASWVESVTGTPYNGDFQEYLKSGVVLCEYGLIYLSLGLSMY